MDLVTIDDISEAAARIDGLVLRTPLVDNQRLSRQFGTRVLLKAENLQHSGSFKVRGALNALLSWQERGELPEGVVSFSAGNHAAAIAYAGKRLGVRVIVAMPSRPVPSKVANVERFGGEIVPTDDFAATLAELAERHGYPILHPFDQPEVIAGQGTAGLELCTDGPPPDLVLVPVGGGGLLSGVGAAVRKLAPTARVVGVEPATSNAMSLALAAGAVVRVANPSATVADGLTAPFAGEHTLPHVQTYVDDVVEVDEDAIHAAWGELVESSKLLVEPASAVCLAALRSGAVEAPEGGVTVLVVSGGNADLTKLVTPG